MPDMPGSCFLLVEPEGNAAKTRRHFTTVNIHGKHLVAISPPLQVNVLMVHVSVFIILATILKCKSSVKEKDIWRSLSLALYSQVTISASRWLLKRPILLQTGQYLGVGFKCTWPAQSKLKPAELVRLRTGLPALTEYSKLVFFCLFVFFMITTKPRLPKAQTVKLGSMQISKADTFFTGDWNLNCSLHLHVMAMCSGNVKTALTLLHRADDQTMI